LDAVELDAVPLFAGLSADDKGRVAKLMKVEDHDRGAVLAEEGDLPTKFYVILEGNVTVHREGSHVADLGAGDYFGEVGVLELEPRNASVIATTPVRVASVMGWDLRERLEEQPDLKAALAESASSRSSSD
jgi:CRP-like cAMP-binding protein